MAITDDKISLIAQAERNLTRELETLDREILNEIIKIYSSFIVNDLLEFDAAKAALIEDQIIAAIKNSSYKNTVNSYVSNFDAITEMNRILHRDLNKVDIMSVVNENNKISAFITQIESSLKGTPSTIYQVKDAAGNITRVPIRNSSLNELIKPLAEQIRKDIILGTSFESATNAIQGAIMSKNLGLSQWAGQITKDALNQADGLQQDEIRKEFGFTKLRYQGTVKDTTRPFCYHMLLEPRMDIERVQSLLGEHIPSGIPSQSITSRTANGKPQKKGSGMIPGTDISNFTIYRGGRGCRHSAVWSN